MSTAICAFIVIFSALCGSRVVSGVLSSPTNVRLTSYNMNLVLRWDPPVRAASGLIYTAEYKSHLNYSAYSTGCGNISTHECDFTTLQETGRHSVFEFGTYIGRVQAQLRSETSAWVESNQITLDKQTTIGSPNVSLFSNGATIEVSIEDPVFAVSTLRDVYSEVTYNITYWKAGQNEKAKHISNIHQNRMVLHELDPWTKYCVKVQISSGWYRNPTKPSRSVCESTTSEEEIPWVAAVVTFVVMAIVVALVVVTVVYWRSISHFLCPKVALPQHFKESLLEHRNPTIYEAMQNPQPPEIYHPIIIIAENITVVGGGTLEIAGTACSKEPDITVREMQEEEGLRSREAVKKR